ncbi:hypothetical protein JS528_07245 [Bifidobacterium sp. MA2]|uniref:Uncharacterized protein n=1 Tax=Bifidobacterium santillanense TaxID=2809028 RepID=A0ABS5UQ97_9BIFI|nr:hypothetical protein [Bifidobacterium santillanense]MBT1173148.1 hypothetical protein [Bifidobacterium santillanense]
MLDSAFSRVAHNGFHASNGAEEKICCFLLGESMTVGYGAVGQFDFGVLVAVVEKDEHTTVRLDIGMCDVGPIAGFVVVIYVHLSLLVLFHCRKRFCGERMTGETKGRLSHKQSEIDKRELIRRIGSGLAEQSARVLGWFAGSV